jgi:hypothetical protein
MFWREIKILKWLLVVGIAGMVCGNVASVWAAPISLEETDLYGNAAGAYLCTQRMARRYPERCPSFSPGAQGVRLEYLRARLPTPLPELPVEDLEVPETAVSNYTFAYITNLPASTYAHPAEAEAGLPAKQTFYAGSNWVSISGRTEYNGQTWYEINSGEFLHGDHVALASPSRFHGVTLREQPQYPFAWINRYVQASTVPQGPANGRALARYDRVTLFAQEYRGDDELWYMIGEDQWVEQSNVSRVDVDPRPEGVGPQERWIEVDTFEQTLAAYEGDRMVFATLVATGLPETWTPDGLNRIWAKLPTTPMINRDASRRNPEWYYLEDVEWTQYFYQDYALHAAYWHNGFAFPRSHGCVNLAPLDAKWLYNWTSPYVPEGQSVFYSDEGVGTWVWVHKTDPFADTP